MNRWRRYFNKKSALFGASFQANDYSDQIAYLNIQDVTYQILHRYGRCNQILLDVGCGNGVLSERLAATFQVIGIDYSLSALAHASQRGIRCIQSSALRLPLKNAIADICASIGMLQYLTRSEFPRLFEELRRVCKNDGIVLISSLNPESILRKIYGLFKNDRGTKFEEMFSIRDIASRLRHEKFDIVEYYYFFTPFKYWRRTTSPDRFCRFLSSTYLVVGRQALIPSHPRPVETC